MPPTTGGSTSGNRTNDLRSFCPGNSPRASTSASGTPNTMQRTVLAAEVRRLRPNAAREDSEVIRGTNCGQLTRSSMAASGRTTRRPPAAATA
ncbi:hypothetical protein PJL18_03650 [Paenarthrobacter nicotinovorans]|nr:hypothetical protein [Paenarthrobacter nicotinovorans]